MITVVSSMFKSPDIGVARFGNVHRDAYMGADVFYMGENAKAHIERAQNGDLYSREHRLGTLLMGPVRFLELRDLNPHFDEVGSNKIGHGIITGEVHDGVTIVDIVHADRRYDSRSPSHNLVSFSALSEGEGLACLNGLWNVARLEPQTLVSSLHEQLGEDAIPQELNITHVFRYSQSGRLYQPIDFN